MSPRLKFFVTVLKTYSDNIDESLRDTIARLRHSESPLENGNLVEDLAEATWSALQQQGVALHSFASVYFLGRPFDDGEVRLVILHHTTVVFNEYG